MRGATNCSRRRTDPDFLSNLKLKTFQPKTQRQRQHPRRAPLLIKSMRGALIYKPVHAAGGTASAACTVQLAWPAASASSPNTEY
jgi:hypothetical protein